MTGILLIAAGESRRLGAAKQLLPWRGEALLRAMVKTAIESRIGPVTVVLGAVDGPCRDVLTDLPVSIIHHPAWAEGMGGSISAGISSMMPRPDGVIVMLCDQPFVDAELLGKLVVEDGKIVACRYHDNFGPPAYFPAKYFDRLIALSGKGGAKELMKSAPDLRWIDAPQAGIDIDTPEDWARHGASTDDAMRVEAAEISGDGR